jgi:hypothetical protein
MPKSKKREDGEVVTYDSSTVTFKKKNKIRKRGRPKKVTMMPANEEARVKKREKDKQLDNDPLINQVQEDPDSLEVLDEVMRELAVENSSLAYERKEAERKGDETTHISSKKVTALKSLSDVYLQKRKELVDESFDFDSPRFEKLLEFFFSKVRTAARNAGLQDETIEILFDKIASLFDEDSNWKSEAKDYISRESQQ